MITQDTNILLGIFCFEVAGRTRQCNKCNKVLPVGTRNLTEYVPTKLHGEHVLRRHNYCKLCGEHKVIELQMQMNQVKLQMKVI